MRSRYEADEIRLFGPPNRVSGTLPSELSKSTVVPISLRVADEISVYRARARAVGGGVCEIRVRLPRATPPGTYRGESMLGDEKRKVTVEIEAKERIRIRPRETVLSGPPGGSVEFRVTVSNDGNVPLAVPKVETIDIDDVRGPERAYGRALRASLKEDERRVDRFFEEVREDHGGEAHVAITEGSGSLMPGQMRELSCRLDIPTTVQEKRTYAGGMDLGSAGHGIVLDVTNGAKGANGRRKRR